MSRLAAAVRALLGGRSFWLATVGLLTLIVAMRELGHTAPTWPRFALLTLAPTVALAATVVWMVWRRRFLVAGTLLMAVTPTMLTSLADGRRPGVVSVVAIVGAIAVIEWFGRDRLGDALLALAGVAVVGVLGWWVATPSGAGAVTLRTSVDGTAGHVREALFRVGEVSDVPMTAQLTWWAAVGVLVVTTVLSSARRATVMVIPLSIGVLVAGNWLITASRNGVGQDDVWVVPVGLVVTAACLALPQRTERRLARLVAAVAVVVWLATIAQHMRDVVADAAPGGNWAVWSWGDLSTTSWPLPLLLIAAAIGVAAAVAPLWMATELPSRPSGVNVVGYHTITAGLGERTRAMSSSLRAAGVPVADYDVVVDATARERSTSVAPAEAYDTTVVVVPSFEWAGRAGPFVDLVNGSRLTAGYWFWELADVPSAHQPSIDLVDEIWAPTTFVRDAYRANTARPVRLVSLPVAEPAVAPIGRDELGLEPDVFVFLVSFSHLSVMERKNPVGAIDAFRCAFPSPAEDADVRLVVKTLNGDLKPTDAARVRAAAADDPRITVRDEHLPHDHLMALIRACDVYVSLHRSEGLGLHIADAMWLGTPVLATDYSGSRDLIDDSCAAVVPWEPIAVHNGDGAYPESAWWADPDLDVASELMCRLHSQRPWRHELAANARQRIGQQPTEVAAGRMIDRLRHGRCAG